MRLKRWSDKNAEDKELNLTAFLDMMVTIIPFLLLTSAFIRLSGIAGELPSYSPGVSKEEDKRIDITLEVKDQKVQVKAYTANFSRVVANSEKSFLIQDSTSLKNYMGYLVATYPHVGAPIFYASPDSTYAEAIQVLDSVNSVPSIKKVIFAVRSVQ